MPTDPVSAYWSSVSGFDGRASHVRHREGWQAAFATAFGPGGPRDVVDLGTGTGACALAAARAGHRVTAIDGSQGMLRTAREAAESESLLVDFQEASIETAPFAPSSFDIATIRNVLWTVRDPMAVLRVAVTLLRPDGRIVVSDGLWSEANARADYDVELARLLPFHAGLRLVDVERLLADAGFHAIEDHTGCFTDNPYETMGSPTFFLVSARKNS